MSDYNREHLEMIKKLNKVLGTNHRGKPYDLTNEEDLKQALIMAVAAYRDYGEYEGILITLAGDFDESLEHFDTSTWFYMGHAPGKADALAKECVSVLNEASDAFRNITERARENLVWILKVILTAPTSTQIAILGQSYDIEPKKIDSCLEELFEMLYEAPYHNPIPDNFNTFLEVMKETWSDME